MKHPKIALDSSMYVNDKKQGEWSQHLRLLFCTPCEKATLNAAHYILCCGSILSLV